MRSMMSGFPKLQRWFMIVVENSGIHKELKFEEENNVEKNTANIIFMHIFSTESWNTILIVLWLTFLFNNVALTFHRSLHSLPKLTVSNHTVFHCTAKQGYPDPSLLTFPFVPPFLVVIKAIMNILTHLLTFPLLYSPDRFLKVKLIDKWKDK